MATEYYVEPKRLLSQEHPPHKHRLQNKDANQFGRKHSNITSLPGAQNRPLRPVNEVPEHNNKKMGRNVRHANTSTMNRRCGRQSSQCSRQKGHECAMAKAPRGDRVRQLTEDMNNSRMFNRGPGKGRGKGEEGEDEDLW